MRRSWVTRALVTTLASAPLMACDVAQDLLNELVPRTGPRKLSDEDAFKHLAPDTTAAPVTDVGAVLEVLDAEAQREAGVKQTSTLSPGARKLLKKASLGRRLIDTERFPQNLEDNLGGTAPKQSCTTDIDLSSPDLKPEFTIPHLDRVPVKNQSYRGTCAAFTGVGALEYAVLNENSTNGNASLPTIDLSEQRFYYASKPDCQADGCPSPYSEGSWYGDGFTNTLASEFDPGVAVPLEADCPDTASPGSTDMGPQPATCEKGAVNVGKLETWCGFEQLIDWLHQGYAVPFGSPLSENWENNDGLITLKDFQGAGSTPHAGGHAYLIVGYKKLPASMPESEGGMCFVVKNSWGTGWGAGGFACMTVGWMRAVKFDFILAGAQPVPVDVLLREDLRAAEELPPDAPAEEVVPAYEPEYEEELPIDVPEEERLDPLPPDADPNGDVAIDEEVVVDPAEDTTPEPPVDAFQAARLLGPSERYFKVKIASEDGELRVRGVLTDGNESRQLRLVQSGKKLVYKGDQVGTLDGDVLTLCTDEFSQLCSLRFRTSDKTLYVQFRDDDLRSVKPEEVSPEAGEWADIALGGQSIGLFVPTELTSLAFVSNPKTYVRFGGGAPTRVSISPSFSKADFNGFDIKAQGLKVGEVLFSDLGQSSLCTGAYSMVCGVSAAADALNIVPRNERRRSN